MKQLYVAAGALLLGTSALAWAADKDATNPVGESRAETTAMSIDVEKQSLIDEYAGTKWSSSAAADLALASSAGSTDKAVLGQPVAAKLRTGDYASWSDDTSQAKPALAGAKANPAVDQTRTATSDEATTAVDQPRTGMGGPIEPMASLTPRPATQNYPPCEPGPGDDNCIQLYEPGVRTQLASWTAPTGGLADGTTAMGGPYEPVAGHAEASAMGALESEAAMNAGATSDAALAADEADVDVDYQGVGGPVVSQSGYPPCEPGPGDDRCIQLYERGVSGAGN